MGSQRLKNQHGMTLIELMVTIVLAGIVFAAMIPMFLTAQSKSSADTMRNVALMIAQEKMESVRQLEYDQITQAHLDSETFYNDSFGNSADTAVGSVTRTFTVDYVVERYPLGSQPGFEQYTIVRVDVYWTGNPQPVKHAILQTIIYRQYAGPFIWKQTVEPRDDDEDGWLTSDSAQITAYVAAPDIDSCTKVRIAVLADNGSEVTAKDVYKPGTNIATKPNAVISESTVAGEYRWTWDASAAPDAVYTFVSIGYATAYSGNTYPMVVRLERGGPQPPGNFTATAGNALVTLSWTLSPSADVDHYELWRSTATGAETLYVDDLSSTTASYTDTGVTNGTTYYYQVYAVDQLAQMGLPTPERAATPAMPASDTTPPTTPSITSVVQVPAQQSLTVAWTASVDNPPPATPSGLDIYVIYRCATNSADPADWLQVGTTQSTVTSFTEGNLGWSTTWWYKVRAKDKAGNLSAYSNAVSQTTVARPAYTLIVTNDRGGNNKYIYVWVKDTYAVPDLWFVWNVGYPGQATKPAYQQINSKGATRTWSNLSPGSYTVLAAYDSAGATPQSQTVTLGPNGSVTFN